MGIMDKVKASFDANEDGAVEAAEVASAVAGAVKVTGAVGGLVNKIKGNK